MRTALRGVGEVLITLGAVLLLFVVYEVWWTTLIANRAAERNVAEIQQNWGDADPRPTPGGGVKPVAGPEVTTPPEIGTPFALMTIPRLGQNMDNKPVLQGVGLDELAQGVGHYPDSALPGQPGNFAVAAHRITLGEPLRYVENLEEGDNVYVETETYWYTYRLIKTQIVLPDEVWTVSANPLGDDPAAPPRKLITLTTCHPTFGNSHRWIWWGELVTATPKSEAAPNKVVNG